jgi:uncharacterized membrane protein YvbJ
MSRCTKCGRKGTFSGTLCNACKSDIKYHFVEQRPVKKTERSNRIKAWWGDLSPVSKDRLKRQTALIIAAVVVILVALIVFLPTIEQQEEGGHGSVQQD